VIASNWPAWFTQLSRPSTLLRQSRRAATWVEQLGFWLEAHGFDLLIGHLDDPAERGDDRGFHVAPCHCILDWLGRTGRKAETQTGLIENEMVDGSLVRVVPPTAQPAP
jgi:hypothetical protein